MRVIKIDYLGLLNKLEDDSSINEMNELFDCYLTEAVEVLESGGIIIYPTDTLYGLGVNAFDNEAVDSLFCMKNRSESKAISLAVSNYSWIYRITKISDKEKQVIEKYLPGPYTFLLNKSEDIMANKLSYKLYGNTEKIGIRIPDNLIPQYLSQKFPITASSANYSGKETKSSIKSIIKQLGCEVDLVVDIGSLKKGSSTVVDLSSDKYKIIREGIGEFKEI